MYKEKAKLYLKPEKLSYMLDGREQIDRENNKFYSIPYTSYSDYSGSLVERSNTKILEETYPFLQKRYGAYGSTWIGFYGKDLWKNLTTLENWKDLWENFVEDMVQLSKYPVLDDDAWCNMEHEETIEQWADYGASDFRKHLNLTSDNPVFFEEIEWGKMNDADIEDMLEDTIEDLFDDDTLLTLFYENNGEAINEYGDNIYFCFPPIPNTEIINMIADATRDIRARHALKTDTDTFLSIINESEN